MARQLWWRTALRFVRRYTYRLVSLSLLLLILVSACSDLSPNESAGPTLPPAAGDATTVARQFLDGWIKGDYRTMYSLIDQKTSPVTFNDVYAKADIELGVKGDEGKSYTILEEQTKRQGTTTVIKYDMTFDSPKVGRFTDAGRTLRLVLTPSATWRVAWSTMDIFEGMAGGATLKAEIIFPQRGVIYDRNGVPFVTSNTRNYAVRLLTRKFPEEYDLNTCLWKLNQIFRVNVRQGMEFYKQYFDVDEGFTIGTLSESEYRRFQPELDRVCFLQYVPQTTRLYAGNSIGMHVVGYVAPIGKDQQEDYPNYPPDALVGQMGVERAYEPQLAGTPGARLVISMPDGTLLREIARSEPGISQDITTTLDFKLQWATENILANAYSAGSWADAWTAPGAGAAAVILDIKTGEVLAMASYPTVNADAFQLASTWDVNTGDIFTRRRAFINRATQEQYAPASVFKVVSTAVATESGAITPNTILTCDGYFESPAGQRTDWIVREPDIPVEERKHGPINLRQALMASCDDFYWQVGEKLNVIDPAILHKYALRMGLGILTGIDVVPEVEGQIPDPDWVQRMEGRAWGVDDMYNYVIGQGNGLQVSVLQVARMMMAVGNGGKLYKPHIVLKVAAPNTEPTYIYQVPQKVEELGFKEEDLHTVQQGLCGVTRDKKIGTAQWVFEGFPLNKVSVCGKTGTSENGPSEPPNAWFAAYAGPAGLPPEIAVVVFVERSREGSQVSAPIVRRILEYYYGLPYADWPAFWSEPYVPMADVGGQ